MQLVVMSWRTLSGWAVVRDEAIDETDRLRHLQQTVVIQKIGLKLHHTHLQASNDQDDVYIIHKDKTRYLTNNLTEPKHVFKAQFPSLTATFNTSLPYILKLCLGMRDMSWSFSSRMSSCVNSPLLNTFMLAVQVNEILGFLKVVVDGSL